MNDISIDVAIDYCHKNGLYPRLEEHDKRIRADVIDDIMELADCDNADCFECAFGSAEMCKLKKIKEQNND